MRHKAFAERPDDGSLLDIYGCSPGVAKMTNTTRKMCTFNAVAVLLTDATKQRKISSI